MAGEVKVARDADKKTSSLINQDKLSSLLKLQKAKEEFSKWRKVVLNSIPDGVDLEELKKTIVDGLKAIEVTTDKQTVTILFKNEQEAEKGVTTLKSLSSDFEDSGITITVPQPDSLLFVGNLPLEFTDEEFEKLMLQYGKLERVFLVRSELTGESKGYGFAEYSDKKTAGEAKQQLLNSGAKYISGRILRVDFAEPNLNTYKDLHSKTLFLDKLPRDFSDGESLRELFSKTGTVTFAQVAIHPQTETSRGFAFVDYATSEEAEKGQKAHNGATIGNCNIRTSFGTPGRLGASVLGVSTSQKPKPGSLMSAVCPNTLIRAPPFRPPPLRQPMIPARSLMARPLMGPRAQMGMLRGPGAHMRMPRFPNPRGPIPLMRPRVPSVMGDPRAPFFQRPMGPRPGMPGICGPYPQVPIRPALLQGPRPLMADGPIRQPCLMPVGPRGVPPRGIMPVPPRPPVPMNGPARPLMDGTHNRGVQQPQQIKGVSRPSNPPARQHMNHAVTSFTKASSLSAQQSPQPLMQSGAQSEQQQRMPSYQGLQKVQPTLQSRNQFMGVTQQSPGVHPGQNLYQQPSRPAGQPVSGLPGQNQQLPVNGARQQLGSTDPAPLMSVGTTSTDEQQGQGRSYFLNTNQTAGGQSVPGQSMTPYQSAGQQSISSYNQNYLQTPSYQGTGMDQSYLSQQSGYQPQQQGMGYVGQSTQSPLYQQQYNTPAQLSSTYNSASLNSSTLYNNNPGSQASAQNHTQKQLNEYSSNQTEPLLKASKAGDLYDHYYSSKRPRY